MNLSVDISEKIIYRHIRKIEILVYILFSTYIPVNYGVGYLLFYINTIHKSKYLDSILDLYSLFIFGIYIWIIYIYRLKIKKAAEPVYLIKSNEKNGFTYPMINGNLVFLILLIAVILSAFFDMYGLTGYELIPVYLFFVATILWFVLIFGTLYRSIGKRKLIGVEILASIGFSVGYLGGMFISSFFYIVFTVTWLFSGIYLFLENERDTHHE